jgi:hypothetical protein
MKNYFGDDIDGIRFNKEISWENLIKVKWLIA